MSLYYLESSRHYQHPLRLEFQIMSSFSFFNQEETSPASSLSSRGGVLRALLLWMISTAGIKAFFLQQLQYELCKTINTILNRWFDLLRLHWDIRYLLICSKLLFAANLQIANYFIKCIKCLEQIFIKIFTNSWQIDQNFTYEIETVIWCLNCWWKCLWAR